MVKQIKFAVILILSSVTFISLSARLVAEDDQTHQPPHNWLWQYEPDSPIMPSPKDNFNEDGPDFMPVKPSIPEECPYQKKKLETLLV